MERPCCGAEDGVLSAARSRIPKTSAAQEKLPGGVKRGSGVRGSVRRRMRSKSGRGIAGCLGRKSCALAWGQIGVVQFERAHVCRFHETHISVLRLAHSRVMPCERANP